MKDHFHDRLIDTLLEEIHRPAAGRDLSAAVFARTTRRGAGRLFRLGWLAAAAVMVSVIGLLFSDRWAATPPLPEAVSAPSESRRVVVAAKTPKTVQLRGYCRVELRPGTRAEVIGAVGNEQLRLQQGALLCRVDRTALYESGLSLEEFKILVADGEITTKGTKPTVFLAETRSTAETSASQLWVKVETGAALVTGNWGRVLLTPGEERLFALNE